MPKKNADGGGVKLVGPAQDKHAFGPKEAVRKNGRGDFKGPDQSKHAFGPKGK